MKAFFFVSVALIVGAFAAEETTPDKPAFDSRLYLPAYKDETMVPKETDSYEAWREAVNKKFPEAQDHTEFGIELNSRLEKIGDKATNKTPMIEAVKLAEEFLTNGKPVRVRYHGQKATIYNAEQTAILQARAEVRAKAADEAKLIADQQAAINAAESRESSRRAMADIEAQQAAEANQAQQAAIVRAEVQAALAARDAQQQAEQSTKQQDEAAKMRFANDDADYQMRLRQQQMEFEIQQRIEQAKQEIEWSLKQGR